MADFFSKLKNKLNPPKIDTAMGVPLENIRPFFDESFYRDHYEGMFESSEDPLEHYMQKGWTLYFDPSPYFSTFYYLHKNPDVKDTGMNPLAHFVHTGKNEKRAIHPDEVNWALDPIYEIPDPAWVMPEN